MLSVERTKELLASLNLSDQEAESIRDVASMFADLAFEAWDMKRKSNVTTPKDVNSSKNP